MTHLQDSKRRWTQTDISRLRSEAADGTDVDLLASNLGRTPDDVRRMATRLNMSIVAAPMRPSGSADLHEPAAPPRP
jgi:predicted metal-dependent phosphotriesterase family hydrolase